MAEKEDILALVKQKGPIITNQIKKELGGESYLIGALLTELSKDGFVKVSNTKIGSSPTYYTPEQEYKLQELKKYLNEKDQETFDILKRHQVLRDKTQEMLTRVGLRNIKDFAKPIEVKIRGEKELFWKWYLTPVSEVEKIIKTQFASKKEKIMKKDEIQKSQKEKVKEEKTESKKEETIVEKKSVSKGHFLEKLHSYFDKKNVEIIEEEIIRKTEIEFRLFIPSSVGKMEYFCKAKDKKKCNDGDLSSAYLKGQNQKLPIMFITTGDVTKKAKDMLGKEFKGMILKNI